MRICKVSRFGRKAAILGTMLVVFSAFAGNRQTCDRYTDGPMNENCGDPPPAGLCSGNCDQITYSAPGGQCVWTGSRWDNCNAVATFTIVETHTYYDQCLFTANPITHYYSCYCSSVVASTTTQTKVCNCT